MDEKIKEFQKFLEAFGQAKRKLNNTVELFEGNEYIRMLPTINESYYDNKVTISDDIKGIQKGVDIDLIDINKHFDVLKEYSKGKLSDMKKEFSKMNVMFRNLSQKRRVFIETKESLGKKLLPTIKNISHRKKELGSFRRKKSYKDTQVAIGKYGFGTKEYTSIFQGVQYNYTLLLFLIKKFGKEAEKYSTNSASKKSIGVINKYMGDLKGFFTDDEKICEKISLDIDRKIYYYDKKDYDFLDKNVAKKISLVLEEDNNYFEINISNNDTILIKFHDEKHEFFISCQLMDYIKYLINEMLKRLKEYSKHNDKVIDKIIHDTEKHRVVLEIKDNMGG